jgi:hypothetical protein
MATILRQKWVDPDRDDPVEHVVAEMPFDDPVPGGCAVPFPVGELEHPELGDLEQGRGLQQVPLVPGDILIEVLCAVGRNPEIAQQFPDQGVQD